MTLIQAWSPITSGPELLSGGAAANRSTRASSSANVRPLKAIDPDPHSPVLTLSIPVPLTRAQAKPVPRIGLSRRMPFTTGAKGILLVLTDEVKGYPREMGDSL